MEEEENEIIDQRIIILEALTVHLTIDFSTEFKETFRLYDEDQDGIVTRDHIAIIMRSLGVSISDNELNSVIKTHCKGELL